MTAIITAGCALPGCPPVRLTTQQVSGFVDDKHRYAISYDCRTCGNTTYKDVGHAAVAALIRAGVHFKNDNPIPADEIREFSDELWGAADELVDRLDRETTP